MQVREVILQRRTIRRFLPEPVPGDILREVLSEALWAPSWGNTQPFEVVVATGDPLERFREENERALREGRTSNPDIPMPEHWPELYQARYRDVGRSVLQALEIPRGDSQARLDYYAQMFSLFGAPALVVVTISRQIAVEYAMLDVGLFLQTLCLAAEDRGLGTAILAASVRYPEIVRRHLSIAEDRRIVMGVAVGRPDSDAPVNRFPRTRAPLEQMVRWVGSPS